MAKINILPAKVYNRIAAGEVVDRPYSVVKELVENAIDAGATEIEIYVEEGGKDLIRVVDNGSGIERDDFHAVFMPHATSKIAKAEDLENIITLGFRGEAVASIASVSQMTITSKTETGKCYSLTSDCGEMGEIIEVSGSRRGTDVKVEGLFYKTPVRFNFLKSTRAEESEITVFVSRFILNRSDIAFTYYVNGKKVMQSFGGGDEEAMVAVYGASIIGNCYKIDAERHGVRIQGYIGNQNFFKSNKSYQSVFLNGRFVINETIATAVHSAYSSYLMKRQYPFYVLHITMPPQVVDVNVHPNKTNVRFANNQTVYGAVYSVVSAVLDGNSKALEYVVSQTVEQSTPTPTKEPSYQVERKESTTLSDAILGSSQSVDLPKKSASVFGFDSIGYEEQPVIPTTPEKDEKTPVKGVIPLDSIPDVAPYSEMMKDTGVKKRKSDPEKLLKYFPELEYNREFLKLNNSSSEKKKKDKQEPWEDYFAENKRLLEEQEKLRKQNKIDVYACQYRGKLFNTYLLYELGDDVFIIDQHAAHERLIYDRLKAKMRSRTVVSQPMLFPYQMSVNAFEAEFLREKHKELADMGFEIVEKDGLLFEVSAIPSDLMHIDLQAFFNEILGDLHIYKSIKLEDILKDKLASVACKSAVKGGMDVTMEEAVSLLEQMDGDMGLKCPHGRPVVVKMSKTELEKMFKRIV